MPHSPLRLFLLLALAMQARPGDGIDRRRPAEFPQLPAAVRAELERRQCRIPQTTEVAELNNVVKGSFEKPGQTDWAVLCSTQGRSTILVFWNGSVAQVSETGTFDDSVHSDGKAYSRMIGIARPEEIRRHYRAYGGPKPPEPLDHAGIDDGVIEKGSSVHYWFGGRWLTLTGSD